MKKLFTSILLLIGLTTFAQTPISFNYQAVLRDASGGILANQQVEIGVTILQGSASGTEVFSETHSVTTNEFGLVNLQIGSVNTADMETIDWSAGPYFIQISVDGTVMGTSQLLSVPFAIHAKTVENDKVEDADADASNELQILSISNDTIYLSNGGKVKLPAETDPTFASSQAVNITATDITNLSNLAGTNTGDQDLSALASKIALGDSTAQVRSEIPDVSGFLTSETDPIYTSSEAANISATDITHLGNLSGTNTGDQDISGITTNATAITAIETEQTTQNDAIALNTAKTGITTAQANAIVANTGKDTTGIYHANRTALDAVTGTNTGDQDLSALASKIALGDSTAQVRSEIPDVSGFLTSETDPIYTSSEAANISATDITHLGNLSGTNTGDQDISGITTNATAITAIETEQTTQNDAIALNTAKTGITTAQANAIVANTGKDTTGIYHANRTALDAVTGVNTGDQDLSALATKTALRDSTAQVRSEIPDVSSIADNRQAIIDTAATIRSDMLTTEFDPVFAASIAAAITSTDTANWNRDTSATNEIELPSQTGNAGKYLTTDGSNTSWEAISTAHNALTLGSANGLSLSGQTLSLAQASTSSAGALSSSDKTKLNKITSYGTTASGGYSTAMGNFIKVSGYNSFGIGLDDTERTLSKDRTMAIMGGNIGIGTTSPSKKLHVYQDDEGQPLLLETNGDYAGFALKNKTKQWVLNNSTKGFGIWDDAASAYRMLIDDDGNIGIGTTSPSKKLHVYQDDEGQPLLLETNGDYAGFALKNKTKQWVLNNSTKGFGIWDDAASAYRMLIDDDGNVGIGTTSPDYPLEVSGSGWYRENQTIAFLELPSSILKPYYGQTTTTAWDYSIVASSYIKAEGLHVFSDRRIKTNIQPNSCKTDLDLVNKMEVVNYQYIDKVEKGNITKKGFIAQQIEEVLPDAVGKSKAFIPDIYKKASRVVADSTTNTLTISTPVAHNLKEGNLLRFITLGGTHEEEVLSVLSDSTFIVSLVEGDCSQVFVYGKKIDDFRAIDYDQVFSAGIGAIQELSRQNDELKQTIENLQNANTALKAEKDIDVEKLQAENSEIKQRLETLEALMKNTLNTITEEKAAVQK